jgi:hypothetical protein
MLQIALDPLDVFRRYYLHQGSYPYTVRLRTPIGTLALELHSWHDFITIHEVFFRQDYRLSRTEAERLRVAVDFGTNRRRGLAHQRGAGCAGQHLTTSTCRGARRS